MSDLLAIEIKNLTFSYSAEQLIRQFNLSIRPGEFVTFIGSNGSGKSTAIKLMLSKTMTYAGKISFFSEDSKIYNTKKYVSACLQEIDFPNNLKVEEILKFVAAQYDNPLDIFDLIKDFNLTDFKYKYGNQLSGGMKRRLALACSVVGRPKILFLDEPTTGLDADSRQDLFKLLNEFKQKTKATVVLVSHYPEEVAHMSNYYILFNKSKINRLEVNDIKQMSQWKELSFSGPVGFKTSLAKNIRHEQGAYTIVTDNSDELIRELSGFDFKGLQMRNLSALEVIETYL